MKRTIMQRFADKVRIDPETGCWEWTGAKDRNGYGQFKTQFRGKQWKTHRFSYEMFVGPIPEGAIMDHGRACRNRGCCNPVHVYPTDMKENFSTSVDHAAKVLASRTHASCGHEFTEENTYREGNSRRCRACRNAAQRARWRQNHSLER